LRKLVERIVGVQMACCHKRLYSSMTEDMG
jgi:hypothetical protein